MAPATECEICGRLAAVETSFEKFGWEEQSRSLPAAAARLLPVGELLSEEQQNHHVRRCPLCGMLYRYDFSYEYLVNGSEDEERLERLTPDEARAFLGAQVRRLEALRAAVEAAESAAGSLGDYIDRGSPDDGARRQALADMEEYRREADARLAELEALVAHLRAAFPPAVRAWADRHAAVCRSFVAAADPTTACVARETLAAWEKLKNGEGAYVRVSRTWLQADAPDLDDFQNWQDG